MSAAAAGYDLHAAVSEPLTIQPGERVLVPTGFAMAMPQTLEAQVRPRSGLAWKHGVTCLNTPGTIDADYRGEVKVMLINHGVEPFVIERGERIAQLVFHELPFIEIEEVDELDSTDRGDGGFGSTGK